jgi:hypothetical protein
VRCLDRATDVIFDDGWYEPNMLPPVARWMGTRGTINFAAAGLTEIKLDLTTHMPNLEARPLGIEVLLNGERLCQFSLYRYGWLELSIPVPANLGFASADRFELEFRSDRTWQPRPVADETRDDRELSVAVCNIVTVSV